MKKEYVKPAMREIKVLPYQLLSGSDKMEFSSGSQDNDAALSKESFDFDDSYDGDEEE